ncbi:MAG: N-acetylmuramoyl-L-alanine amidase [Eubacterium sp.]|nr:N-acetylmuramoyl-L-alanine amidase [Eubacterium sp.]
MSNSNLVSFTKISPNRTSPRNHNIDTITIHCVVGQCSVETLGNIFAPTSREASSNYGIGADGRIGMYVEEKDRSWCSSNAANDNRAITIEVASDTTDPYAVNEKAYAALLDLVTDICKRNGIKKLVWSTNKSDRVNHANGCNMTVHRDYANKSCPGDYLYSRHGEIAAEVNRRLGAADSAQQEQPAEKTLYKVQIGAFSKKANATALEKKVKAAGFDTFVVNVGGLYKVQVGAFSVKANAEAMQKKLIEAGYSDAFITGSSGTAAAPSAPAAQIKEGSSVRLKQGAPTYTGGSLASYVYDRVHVVKEISGKRAVITFSGIVVAAVNVDDLTLA